MIAKVTEVSQQLLKTTTILILNHLMIAEMSRKEKKLLNELKERNNFC